MRCGGAALNPLAEELSVPIVQFADRHLFQRRPPTMSFETVVVMAGLQMPAPLTRGTVRHTEAGFLAQFKFDVRFFLMLRCRGVCGCCRRSHAKARRLGTPVPSHRARREDGDHLVGGGGRRWSAENLASSSLATIGGPPNSRLVVGRLRWRAGEKARHVFSPATYATRRRAVRTRHARDDRLRSMRWRSTMLAVRHDPARKHGGQDEH
jgi:hypothetical protein